MIKKAIKILAAAVVAIAAFAFAGTTEARAETLLSGGFSSLGQLDAQFDVYGDTPVVDGSLELLPEGETLVLSKRGDFDEFRPRRTVFIPRSRASSGRATTA